MRHDGLDEADLERLLGVDDVGGEREPARPVAADHLGAAHEPVAGLQADHRLAEPERGAVGRDHDVAGKDDLGAAAIRDAVDRGDHGQLGALDRVEGVEHEPEVAPGGRDGAQRLERRDVAAGRERISGAGEDDGAHAVLAAEAVEHLRELAEERRIHRVLLLGPVDPDDGDRVSALDAENLELAHVPPSVADAGKLV